MIVTVTDAVSGFQLVLDRGQTELFAPELAAARRRKPRHGAPEKASPDCRLAVQPARGPSRGYLVYERATLVEEGTNRAWPFYFGILLLEWLYLAQSPVLPVPFDPAVP